MYPHYISAWVTQSKEITRHDERLKVLEKDREEIRIEIKELKDKQESGFKDVSAKLETIRLLIENKQDRKK
jgi:hypothetical protein